MAGKSVDAPKTESLTLKEAADAVERYKAEFFSSSLSIFHTSSPSSSLLAIKGRESSIGGSSLHQIECGIVNNELDHKNYRNKSDQSCFSVRRLSPTGKENDEEDLKKGASENDTVFVVPQLPRKTPFRKLPSSNSCRQTEEEKFLDRSGSKSVAICSEYRFLPGKKTSGKKVDSKLALLLAREVARKEAVLVARQKRLTNKQKINSKANDKKFSFARQLDGLTSMSSALKRAEVPNRVSLTEKGDFGDATYTVLNTSQGLEEIHNVSIPGRLSASVDEKLSVMQTSVMYQISNGDAAITSEERRAVCKMWINCLLRHCTGSLRELFENEQVVSDGFLRDVLQGRLTEKSQLESKAANSIENYEVEKISITNVVRKMHSLLIDVDISSRIISMVEKGYFEMKRDIHLFSDVGLQMRLLKLFFSFNMFWLRCGLEALFNVTFSGPSHLLYRKLAMFIIKRFFKEPTILSDPKCAKGRNRSLITELGCEKLGRNFQSKFYQLLFLIDWTKSENVLRFQTPALFLKSSYFKSVEEVIDALQKEILSGSVIASKLLVRIGFKPMYYQGFLDEYSYVVKNLSTDLSDGVILSRLVEVVCNLKPYSVASSLRNPCGDRLRKLENIKRVFEAAKLNGFDLEAKPESLLQGKIEDIMETVWQLIGPYVIAGDKSSANGKYNPQSLWKAATVIQRAYRAYRKKKVKSKEFMQPQSFAKEDRILFTPQVSGHENDKKDLDYNASGLSGLSARAALVTQGAHRKYRTKKLSKIRAINLLKFACAYERNSKKKRVQLKKVHGEAHLEQRKVIRQLKELFSKRKATIVIHRIWRGFLARRNFRKLKHNRLLQIHPTCVKLKPISQPPKGNNQSALEMRKRSTCIQHSWQDFESKHFSLEERKEFRRYHEAACIIQRSWRLYKARQTLIELKRENAACVIQKHIRGFLVRRRTADFRRILAEKMAEFRLKDEANTIEQARPALSRIIDALRDLVSNDLRRRDYAALTLGRITTVSDECGLYIYKQRGLLFLLDALDSSNRGVHESRVVVHLLLSVYNILKIKTVQNDIAKDEQLVQDLVKSCFHYFLAFYKVYDAALNSAKCLLFIAGINPAAKKFTGARYYITEGTRKFKALHEKDELAISVVKLKNVYLD